MSEQEQQLLLDEAMPALPASTESAVPTVDPDTTSLNSEEIAMTKFYALLPQFNAIAATLSSRQLGRTMRAILEAPFNQSAFKFVSPLEEKLFAIGMEIMDCKMILVQSAIANLERVKNTDIDTLKKEVERVTNEQAKEESNVGTTNE
jgi:hypothetical protein